MNEDEIQIEEELNDESIGLQNRMWANARQKFETSFNEHFKSELNVKEIKEEFQNIDAMEEIASTQLREPEFPMFTFSIALFIDILGFLDFTGIGWLIMCIVEIVFTIILFFLMFGKLNMIFTGVSKAAFKYKRRKGRRKRSFGAQGVMNKFVKKYLRKYISRRLIVVLVVKLIPFIGILGSSAFFVVLAHNKQKKIVKKYMFVVEKVGTILQDFYRRTNR